MGKEGQGYFSKVNVHRMAKITKNCNEDLRSLGLLKIKLFSRRSRRS
jgi:hypothetical protein